MRALACKQRGIGLFGFIGVAVGIIFVAILGMKMGPAYIHSAQIAQIFRTIAGDPAMRDAPINEIRGAYDKRANINYISDITADDIEVHKDGGELSLSAQYFVKIHLVGNVTLLLEFNPSSS